MKLKDLIISSGVELKNSASMIHIIEAKDDLEITGITNDSRKVKPGYLFAAVKGLEHDGYEYIVQAIDNGAAAIIYSDNSKFKVQSSKLQSKIKNLVRLETLDTRKALGLLWASWYKWPSKKLKVIGVTGTDGKTTTANLIYHILKNAGKKVGLISTINARIRSETYDTGFHVTNPEPEQLQKFLRLMVDKGINIAVLEVTSHGIDQERIAGINFDMAVVTNVTYEHLDYHKTYENYLKTKGRLVSLAKLSILNHDDSSFDYLKGVSEGTVISYGLETTADYKAENVTLHSESSTFIFMPGSFSVRLNLPGRYNISNTLAAATAVLQLGLSVDDVASGIKSFQPLPGRFEEIKSGQSFRVIVDFAHTPNALENVLLVCREIQGKVKPLGFADANPKGLKRIICVFGCAGERDKEKRPKMGEISGKLANISILTAEDPRRENVNEIITEIASGCFKSGAVTPLGSGSPDPKGVTEKNIFIKEPDRRKAIELAVRIAQKGDIILITGKGHEKSMCFGTTEYPWSDQEVVRETLNNLKS